MRVLSNEMLLTSSMISDPRKVRATNSFCVPARAADYCSSLDVLSDWLSCTTCEIKEILRHKQLTSFTVSLTAKPLHGKFFTMLQSGEEECLLVEPASPFRI